MLAGSLFTGIGGLDLGLVWSGLVTNIAWRVEIDEFPRRVLDLHFPNANRSVIDVREASRDTLRDVELIYGGFPCQDVSSAGKGAGLSGDRSGLWYEFRRVVSEFTPPVVLVENVASGAARWVCAVRSDLRTLGYRTAALNIGVDDCGGPHRRRRVFILAYANSGRQLERKGGERHERRRIGNSGEEVADANGEHSDHRGHGAGEVCGKRSASSELRGGCGDVADAERSGRDERSRSCGDRAGLGEPANSHIVANSNSKRREATGSDGSVG